MPGPVYIFSARDILYYRILSGIYGGKIKRKVPKKKKSRKITRKRRGGEVIHPAGPHGRVPIPHMPFKGSLDEAGPLKTGTYPIKELQNAWGSFTGVEEATEFLDFEGSERYKKVTPRTGRHAGKTFTACNIALYDMAYALGIPLPKVWYYDFKAAQEYYDRTGDPPPVKYADPSQPGGVKELNANAQTDWLAKYGMTYGYITTVVSDLHRVSSSTLEDLAFNYAKNTKLAVIIAAKNHGGIGHVAIVLPDDDMDAMKSQGLLVAQAGGQCFNKGRTPFYRWKQYERVVVAVARIQWVPEDTDYDDGAVT